jgi:hypothetical protein
MLLRPSRLFRRPSLILACVFAFGPTALRAQAEVEPGARIRLLTSSADTLMYGTLVTLDSASLLLAPKPDAEAVRVPLAGLERLEVSRGRARSTLTGAAVGAVIGALGGYYAAKTFVQPEDCEFVCGAVQAWSAGAGGVLGLIMGGGIGSDTEHGPERWRPVPLDRD